MTELNGTPQFPEQAPAPRSRTPSPRWTRTLIWAPVALVVLGGGLSGVAYLIAMQGDGGAGGGLPDGHDIVGLIGYMTLLGLVGSWPVLVGSFIFGLVRLRREREAARSSVPD